MHMKPLYIPVPGCRFSHMHVDLVGLLPASEGCMYLFTIIDCTTRWAEAVLLATTSADHVQTIAYHPEGNVFMEWFHHCLKDALRARCTAPDWI